MALFPSKLSLALLADTSTQIFYPKKSNKQMNSKEGRVTVYDSSNSRTVLKTDSIVDSVIDKIIDRARVGKDKYKTDLDREDLGIIDWLTNLQEELLDAANYIEKIKTTLSGKKGRSTD